MKYYWAIMEKPSRTTKFLRSLETLKEFDGEEGGSSSSDTGSSSSGAIAAPVIRSANSFMMVTLLDVLCSFYTTEPDTNDKLLKVLLKQLATNKIIAPLFEIDELSSVRSQFKHTFCQMIETALATLNQDVNVSNTSSLRKVTSLLLQPHLPRDQLIFSSVSGFYNSRYKDDFLEEELIGHGAYGNVFRVKNKLDGHEYAVKKIIFVAWESEFWLHKLLREVTHLANLQHPNIVRYHNAWFEYDSPWMDWMRKRSRQPALLWESDSAKVTESSDVETSELISAAHFCRAVTEWCGPEETDDIVFEASAASAQHACPEMEASGPTANSFYPDIYTELSHIPTRERLSGGDNPLPQQKACVVLHIQMELCEMTLSDWLSDRNSKLSHSDDSTAINKDITSKILKEILKGVDYMHDHNIIHRDLKPMNIFLQITSGCNNMRVKIGDFGLARNTYCDDVSRVPQSPLTPNPTQKGDAPILTEGIGTTTYAAPEQINGTNYNNKCDMYSLGFIMLELYQPFSTVMERSFTLRDLREGRLLESFKTSWPAQATCIGSLTDVDPTRRPSARDVLDGELFSNKDKATCIGSLTDVDPTRRPSARDVLDGELFSNKDKIINDLKNVIKSKDERILELERAMSAMEKKIKNHPPANI